MKSKLTLSTLMACLIVGNVGFAAVTEVDGTTETLGAGNYQGIKVTNNGVVNINAENNEVVFAGKEVNVSAYSSYTGLYANNGELNINADKLTFNSLKQPTDADNGLTDYAGLENFAGWFDGNTNLQINVNELYIGSAEMGGDRGFQLKGANNKIDINADRIVAYVGDGFVNAQGDESGSSIVNIGTANDRIGYFEAHATFGKDDYGVALLQANEGNIVNLYADTAILDGSSNPQGGVIGSGGYGTVNVVAGDLTISGNICGTYGGRSDDGKTLSLNVTADNLNMNGNINIGSMESGNSKFNRDTKVNITVTENANITGDINVYGNDADKAGDDSILNVDFKNNAVLTGKINVEGELGTVNLGGNADMTSSSGIYNVTKGGNVNFTGGNWAVNEWSGDDGNINVNENATVNINNTITVANAVIDGDVVLDTDKVTGAAITANNSATLSSSSNIILANVETGDVLTTKLFGGTASNVDELNSDAVSQMKTDNLMQNVTTDQDGNIIVGVADASEVLPNVAIGGIITSLTANNIHNDFFDDVLKSGDAAKTTAALNSVANMGELAGVNHGTYSMSNAMTDAVAHHLSLATHGEQDKDIWAHYIHNKEDIDGMDFGGVDGSYEAQYNGIVVGSDLYKNGKTTAGIALSYADGNINGSNIASSTKNDAEYYGASLYGRIDNGDSAILGDISYMHSDNDITQNNSGHEITASADADAFSIGIRAEQAYKAGAGKFVPYAGIRYMHLGAGDYSNSLGMEYNADDQNLWLLPVGVTYSAEVQSGDWTVKPIAEVGYVWTMGDRDTDQTVSLNGASDTFGFETADSGSFIGRLGIEAEKADVTYGLSYEYQKGDTVKANKWMVNLTYSF